jgi:NADH-quinone oxidoreductase subunit L
MMNYAWLILLLPLIGFLLIGLNYRWLPVKITGWIASATVLISFFVSTVIFFELLDGAPPKNLILFDWLKVGNVYLPVELLIDQLSVLMLLIITGVGFLIHVYSIGYMHGDEGYNRYFAYMNLFVFFMIILVLGGSYTIMFIGWEGVGLCSYLLIGFWYKNHEYNNAAKKAFIMNRIGDLGFLIGMFFIYYAFESLSYSAVFSKAATLIPGTAIITVTTLFLFIGAVGKSAQIPLLTWLPDAMAGPTPVSALIHAATMVTAGVYMVARSNILYAMAPFSMNVVAITGLATSLLAATIALFQNDIKKVLAYSTISQLGLMFLGLGVGAFAGAMFHLMTHAFFKALLFLAAGSIIHALGGEQDLRNMGGLRKKIPMTFIVFLVATLAIAGIPPFAGFFSKDEILSAVYLKSPVLWILGVAVSVMTAFYIFRVLYLSFSGSYRGTIITPGKIHESPGVMTIPLLLLALLSLTGGYVGLPQSIGENRIGNFLTPVFADASYFLQNNGTLSTTFNFALMGAALFLIAVSSFGAWYIFVKRGHTPANENIARKVFARIAYNKFYIDELYRVIIVKPFLKLSDIFHDRIDTRIFDRAVEAIGKLVMKAGERIRLLQTGNVGFYLFAMVICIIIVLAFSVFGK